MLVKLAFAMQKLKKNVLKSFGHDQERWGGGVQFLDFMGGHSCYEGDIELMGRGPPTRKNPGKVWLANVKFMSQSQHHIYIYIYCFQRISQNIKANKPTRSCEFPCQPFV